jgi:hypothetical protein
MRTALTLNSEHRTTSVVGRDACRLGIAPRRCEHAPNGAIPRHDTGHRALQYDRLSAHQSECDICGLTLNSEHRTNGPTLTLTLSLPEGRGDRKSIPFSPFDGEKVRMRGPAFGARYIQDT